MSYINPDDWQEIGVLLEPAAKKIVRSTKNTLVIAGPGAGKTELLAQRASFLLDTRTCSPPERILAISFKRNAAKNLAERVAKRCKERAERFDSMTFDAFAKVLIDKFRMALPEEWRPEQNYKLETNIRDKEMKEWLISAGISKDALQRCDDRVIKARFGLVCHGYSLPYTDELINSRHKELGLLWWKEQIAPPSRLTFPMLTRLAAYLLIENPKLLKALRATYRFVFLDEFQDVTSPQYELLTNAFSNSNISVTAVGDRKQGIMSFAGALNDVFGTFKVDFHAEEAHLIMNHRSMPKLIKAQQVVARTIDGDVNEITPAKSTSNGAICVMQFSDSSEEAEYLAELIKNEIESGQKCARDFCVIVRQKTGQMIESLQKSLISRGVKLRDESLLQELLAKRSTHLLLAVLRLATRKRDPEAWSVLTTEIARFKALDKEDDAKIIYQESRKLIDFTESRLNEEGDTFQLLMGLVSTLGPDIFLTFYNEEEPLDESVRFLASTLDSFKGKVATFKNAIDELIGVDSVPALTIHKSKGLEFNTVIILGFEDSQWWGYSKNPEEETKIFFVAISRAIENVYITYSEMREKDGRLERQKRSNLTKLYELLESAGVLTVDSPFISVFPTLDNLGHQLQDHHR